MTRVLALLRALVAAVAVAFGRLRVRWYRWKQLPVVRETLENKTFSDTSDRLRGLPDGPPVIPDDARSTDFLSIPTTLAILRDAPEPTVVLASTRILPAPPLELAIFRPDRFAALVRLPLDPRRLALSRVDRRLLPATPRTARLDIFDPTAFGLDPASESARPERAAPRPVMKPIASFRPRPPAPPKLARPPPRDVVRPEDLALDARFRPAAEQVPPPRRLPHRPSRAAANFTARYVDPSPHERFAPDHKPTFGEEVDEGVRGFFEGAATIGATDAEFGWNIDPELEDQLGEVHEQFLLRRDADKLESEEDDIGKPAPLEGTSLDGIVAYMGFEFENLQLQPVKVLRMSDENTGPPLKPFVEDAETRLKWIQSAMSTFSDAPSAADAKA